MYFIDKLKIKLGFLPENAPYEFSFPPGTLTDRLPQFPVPEMRKWLDVNCSGKWKYILEMGEYWGVGFYDEKDAMAFKLRWI